MSRISSFLWAIILSCLVCGSVLAGSTSAAILKKDNPYQRFSKMLNDASQDGLSKPDVAALCTINTHKHQKVPNARLVRVFFNNKTNEFSFRSLQSSHQVKQMKKNPNVALLFNLVTPSFPYRQFVVYGKASIIPGSIRSLPGSNDKLVSYSVVPRKIKFTDSVDASTTKPDGAKAIHLEDYAFNERGESKKVRDKVYHLWQD